MSVERTPKKFLGVLFRCCGVYARIYRKTDATAYEGRCPKCMKPLRVAIDPQQGIDANFLECY